MDTASEISSANGLSEMEVDQAHNYTEVQDDTGMKSDEHVQDPGTGMVNNLVTTGIQGPSEGQEENTTSHESAGGQGSEVKSGSQPAVQTETADLSTEKDDGKTDINSSTAECLVDGDRIATEKVKDRVPISTKNDDNIDETDGYPQMDMNKISSYGKSEVCSANLENGSVPMETVESEMEMGDNITASHENGSTTKTAEATLKGSVKADKLQEKKEENKMDDSFEVNMEDNENRSGTSSDNSMKENQNSKTPFIHQDNVISQNVATEAVSSSHMITEDGDHTEKIQSSDENEISKNSDLGSTEPNDTGLKIQNVTSGYKADTNTKSFEMRNIFADFDTSEASESDQSPRLVIAMPDFDESENESLSTKTKEKTGTTVSDSEMDKQVSDRDIDNSNNANNASIHESSNGQGTVTSDTNTNVLTLAEKRKKNSNTVTTDAQTIQSLHRSEVDQTAVKLEPQDDIVTSSTEEGGDILDILNSKNTQNSVIVADRSNVNNPVIADEGTENDNSGIVRTIKTEPVDNAYKMYSSAYSDSGTVDKSKSQNKSMEHFVHPSQPNSSLSQLSKQVASLAPSSGPRFHQVVPPAVTGNQFPVQNPTNVQISNSKILKVSYPNTSASFQAPTTAKFTRMPVVLQPTVAANSKSKSYTVVPVQVSKSAYTSSLLSSNKPLTGNATYGNIKSKVVMVGSQINQPKTTVTPIQKADATLLKVSAVPTVTSESTSKTSLVQRLSVPALLQNNVKVTQPPELPVTSINIDTVGLHKITELIARKNPIPNYKPPPIPQNLKSVLGPRQNFVCYECGDTFALASSAVQHRGRYSMKITFKCIDCNHEKVFFNKCQFLGHLRGHMNIEKTQAVPIHIKSDSITISTLPEEYQKMMFQQKIDSTKEVIFKEVESTKRCRECGIVMSTGKLGEHYGKGLPDSDERHICGQCHMRLPTTCALRAHRRFHRKQLPNICPECGLSEFSYEVDKKEKVVHPYDSFCLHLRDECFHFSRCTGLTCPKCSEEVDSDSLRHHLMQNLEQYYKCQACPMAFKLQETFKKHCDVHIESSPPEFQQYANFKVIYRCHICDSVMDDRGVLEVHTSHHITDMKDKLFFRFKCLCCGKNFKEKNELKKHFSVEHSHLKGSKKCFQCNRIFSTVHEATEHHSIEHVIVRNEKIFFKSCLFCGIMLKLDELTLHMNTCVARDVKRFKCDICSKINSTKQGHTLHLKRHKSLGELVCLACNKTDFKGVDDFKNHESTCSKRFKCDICPMICDTKTGHALHLKRHKNLGELVCLSCNKTDFKDIDDLKNHESTCSKRSQVPQKQPSPKKIPSSKKVPSPSNVNFHTNVGVHPCTTEGCGQSFVTLEELNQHRKNDHGLNLLFPCHLCGLTYENQTSLHKHIKVTHEAKRRVYPCWVCRSRKIKKVFSTKALLEKHVTSRHRIPKDQLDESQFVREYQDDDERDMGGRNFQENMKRKMNVAEQDSPVKKLRIDGENTFNCAKCRYSSENRAIFLEHIATHKLEKYMQCFECGLSFAVLPSLQKHLFMVHKIKDFDAYCQETGIEQIKEEEFRDEDLVLTVQSDDSEQIQVDEEEKNPLECCVCHKMFDSETNVRNHMRTHGMAFIRSKRKTAKMANSTSSSMTNGNESSDSSQSANPS